VGIGVFVGVGNGVRVGVGIGVFVGVGFGVGVGIPVGVIVTSAVGVKLMVVGEGTDVAVAVAVGPVVPGTVATGVGFGNGVRVGVGLSVGVGIHVGVIVTSVVGVKLMIVVGEGTDVVIAVAVAPVVTGTVATVGGDGVGVASSVGVWAKVAEDVGDGDEEGVTPDVAAGVTVASRPTLGTITVKMDRPRGDTNRITVSSPVVETTSDTSCSACPASSTCTAIRPSSNLCSRFGKVIYKEASPTSSPLSRFIRFASIDRAATHGPLVSSSTESMDERVDTSNSSIRLIVRRASVGRRCNSNTSWLSAIDGAM